MSAAAAEGSRVPLLEVAGASVSFGGVHALTDIDLSIEHGEIRGLIGPNGAGKTTLLNSVCRLQRLDRGAVRVNGRSILGRVPSDLAHLGIGRTFQHAQLSPHLSVLDNVLLGTHARRTSGMLGGVLGLPRARRELATYLDVARGLLDDLELSGVADVEVGSLPTPVRKRIDIARALAGAPELLLMDEPAAGLNDIDVSELGELIRSLVSKFGVRGVLLVEHHVAMVMTICARVTVLNFGVKIAEGLPREVRSDSEVISAYLGSDVGSEDGRA